MTHVPAESTAWPRAGADDRASVSGDQAEDRPGAQAAGEGTAHGRASDLPSAAWDPEPGVMPPFPEARQHEGWFSAQHAQAHHDEAYRAWRDEHARQLDDDYQAFRRERFRSEFEGWRAQRQGDATRGR